MTKRKPKRTAGQRRYLALQRKTESVRQDLISLQNSMQLYDKEGKQARQMYVMQRVTEAIERLGVERI